MGLRFENDMKYLEVFLPAGLTINPWFVEVWAVLFNPSVPRKSSADDHVFNYTVFLSVQPNDLDLWEYALDPSIYTLINIAIWFLTIFQFLPQIADSEFTGH